MLTVCEEHRNNTADVAVPHEILWISGKRHLGASQDGGSPKSSKSSEHLSNYVLLVTWESPIERNPQMDP